MFNDSFKLLTFRVMESGEDAMIGDDDSFEDQWGKPHYPCLFDYVAHKICEGMTVTNQNGIDEPKKGATISELGIYYYTHRALIKAKRAKYEAYNTRKKKKIVRDYIYSTTNTNLFQATGHRIEEYIRDNDPDYHLYKEVRPGITTMSSKQIKRIATESAEARLRRIEQAIRTKTLRIEDIETEKELINYFAYHIKFQDLAIKSIAHTIFGMKSSEFEAGDSDQNANIISILASGVSGTGKTALVELIRPLFHMEIGAVNAVCYVELRFANYSDSSHRNAINGPGPGYEGMSEPCLVDKLEMARLSIEQRGPSHAEHPNIILVFIDELCKPRSDVRVLDSLNSLFSEGILNRASGNITFRLPDNCRLLFYSTANYGESDIVNYIGRRNDRRAIAAIRHDMKRKGVQSCDSGRIGNIVPFFPLKPTEAKEILRFNLEYYFDTPRYFQMLSEDRARFVDFYFTGNYTRAHGVRTPTRILKQELQHIRTLQRKLIIEPPPDGSRSPLLLLRFNIIPREEYSQHFGIDIESDDEIDDHSSSSSLSSYHEAAKNLCEYYDDLALAVSRDDVDIDNIIDSIETKCDIGYASLCHQGKPIVVYVARPQIQQYDDEEVSVSPLSSSLCRPKNCFEDYSGDAYDDEMSPTKEAQIRSLLANTAYKNNPLAPKLYEIMGISPPHTVIVVPNVQPKRKNDHVTQIDDNTNDEPQPKKKRQRRVDAASEIVDDMATKQCQGPCNAFKPIKVFIRKRNNNGGTSTGIADICSTCRKGKGKTKEKG